MLQLARDLCAMFAPTPFPSEGSTSGHFNRDYDFDSFGGHPNKTYPPYADLDFPLIASNGDAEMWRHLCMDFSPWLIRVYSVSAADDSAFLSAIYRVADPWAVTPAKDVPYPAEKGLLDQNSQVVNTADPTKNHYAACLRGSYSPKWGSGAAILKMPLCDEAFLKAIDDDAKSTQRLFIRGEDAPSNSLALSNWAARGATAAGMSVFSYLKAGGAQKPVRPYFNECELVRKAP